MSSWLDKLFRVGGATNVSMTGDTALDEDTVLAARLLVCTGTLTANANLVVPMIGGLDLVVQNSTTGGKAITVKGSSGTGVVVRSGDVRSVICTGTAYIDQRVNTVPYFGRAAVVMPSDADYTVPTTAYGAHVLEVTSAVALTALRGLILPLVDGAVYRVKNSTTGGQSITAKGATGTGQNVINGQTVSVYCDGTNYYLAEY